MKSILKIVAATLVCIMPLTASAQMITEQNSTPVKKQVELSADVVVCGGGLAGVCAAVLLGVQALGNLLPGYKVEASGSLIVFLIIYSGLAIFIGKLLNERYEDAN